MIDFLCRRLYLADQIKSIMPVLQREQITSVPRLLALCGTLFWHIGGLVQERRNSITNALELRISCTDPSTCDIHIHQDCFTVNWKNRDSGSNVESIEGPWMETVSNVGPPMRNRTKRIPIVADSMRCMLKDYVKCSRTTCYYNWYYKKTIIGHGCSTLPSDKIRDTPAARFQDINIRACHMTIQVSVIFQQLKISLSHCQHALQHWYFVFIDFMMSILCAVHN